MTVGTDYLWALYSDGRCKRLASDWLIDDYLIVDNFCYYLSRQTVQACDKCEVYVVDLSNGKRNQLGDQNYFYNVSIKKDQTLYVLGYQKDPDLKWHVTNEGVIITGIYAGAVYDEIVGNEELMKDTYGVYLLPLDGGEPVMRSKIDVR